MAQTKVEKQMIPVRIPKELNGRLTEYLAPRGITKNSFILGLINRELEGAALAGRQMDTKQA